MDCSSNKILTVLDAMHTVYDMSIYIDAKIPLKTVSECNLREHWRQRHKRAVGQKFLVEYHLKPLCEGVLIPLPCKITLTRIGKRRMDTDNLAISFKHVRDAAADILFDPDGKLCKGRADGDPRIDWIYAQEISKEYSIKIKVES